MKAKKQKSTINKCDSHVNFGKTILMFIVDRRKSTLYYFNN